MRRFMLFTVCGMVVVCVCCLVGCTAKEESKNNENSKAELMEEIKYSEDITDVPWDVQFPVKQESTGQTDPSKEQPLLESRACIEEKMDALETKDITELDLYAGEELSLLNSNVLRNLGYLTYDEEGNIYFSDQNIGGIFVSNKYGKNRWQLTPDSGENLQLVGEWLYYQSTDKTGIKRIHLETKETEVVRERPCIAFAIWEDKLYINGFEGFCVAEPDGSNTTVLHDRSLTMNGLQLAEGGIWLGNAYNDEDYYFLLQGHLLTYEEENNVWHYVEKGAREVLLAGKWLSAIEKRTGKRVVWNLETDTKFELNIFDDKVVGNGSCLYGSVDGGAGENIFYCFDGVEKKELFRVKSALHVHEKYLTPDMLYWIASSAGGNWLYELWYYELGTGVFGKIY